MRHRGSGVVALARTLRLECHAQLANLETHDASAAQLRRDPHVTVAHLVEKARRVSLGPLVVILSFVVRPHPVELGACALVWLLRPRGERQVLCPRRQSQNGRKVVRVPPVRCEGQHERQRPARRHAATYSAEVTSQHWVSRQADGACREQSAGVAMRRLRLAPRASTVADRCPRHRTASQAHRLTMRRSQPVAAVAPRQRRNLANDGAEVERRTTPGSH